MESDDEGTDGVGHGFLARSCGQVNDLSILVTKFWVCFLQSVGEATARCTIARPDNGSVYRSGAWRGGDES